MIDAPVSGGAAGAVAGTLTIFLGGLADDIDYARPLLQTYGARLSHLGGVGAGQAGKACNQIVNFGAA